MAIIGPPTTAVVATYVSSHVRPVAPMQTDPHYPGATCITLLPIYSRRPNRGGARDHPRSQAGPP